MDKKSSINLSSKARHHKRNRHRDGYDFNELKVSHPPLADHISVNKYDNESINFFDPEAVKALNTALLKKYYGVTYWDIPEGFLCPPVPGRADYIHNVADVAGEWLETKPPRGVHVRCLDLGVGANCIYPIIANAEYGWSFVGTDIIDEAIASANTIVDNNEKLKGNVEIRKQSNPNHILQSVINPDELFDLVICNPPFHKSKEEALKGTIRKIKNLKGEAPKSPILNFGGKNHELWYEGGEKIFIKRYIHESKAFAKSCLLFSTLVSKEKHVDDIEDDLIRAKVANYEMIKMGQGNKSSHLIIWSFLNKTQLSIWKDRLSNDAKI